jgi:hypothetical protein
MKIALDLDNTISCFPRFFRMFCRAMQKEGCRIHIVTNRPKGTEAEVIGELDASGISYDGVKITADKAEYIHEQEIEVFFDDTDEYFIDLPESVAVFKPREPGNFDFEQKKWIYGPRTGRSIGQNAGPRNRT